MDIFLIVFIVIWEVEPNDSRRAIRDHASEKQNKLKK
jgi:hypothetical protein